MPQLTASLVCYRTPPAELEDLFASLNSTPGMARWVVVNNAAYDDAAGAPALQAAVTSAGGQYIPCHNAGFGAGHNLAIACLANFRSDYHLLVNPDITMGPEVLPALTQLLEDRPQVCWVMPKILYEDGRTQHLCKLLPSPGHFAIRRFLPGTLQRRFQDYLDSYELRGIEESEAPGVPFLSGCFVFARRETLESVGGFDDRYFLYMEDVDLCRRMAAHGTLLYWPGVAVEHGYHRGSHRNLKLTWAHIRSSITYFNRWGWFSDRERTRINEAALAMRARLLQSGKN